MSKLQRAVDGQVIQFLTVPKVFNTLSADLPSGGVLLPNGDVAYWRLHRNLTELKKARKSNMRDLILKLAQTFKAIVTSDSFLNHYGLEKAPEIPNEIALCTLFRSLLVLNTNRVDYNTISHGRQKPLTETIIVALGNLAFFNAYRGLETIPRVDGIKGKLYLKEGHEADQAFSFTVVSPVVKLNDRITEERLANEILNKVRQNLPLIAHNPRIVFNEGQLDANLIKNYVDNRIQDLAAKHAHPTNKKPVQPQGKQQQALTKQPPAPVQLEEVKHAIAGLDLALSKESFDGLPDEGKARYLENVASVIDSRDNATAEKVIRDYLDSGILADEFAEYQKSVETPSSHQGYLAKIISLPASLVILMVNDGSLDVVKERMLSIGEALTGKKADPERKPILANFEHANGVVQSPDVIIERQNEHAQLLKDAAVQIPDLKAKLENIQNLSLAVAEEAQAELDAEADAESEMLGTLGDELDGKVAEPEVVSAVVNELSGEPQLVDVVIDPVTVAATDNVTADAPEILDAADPLAEILVDEKSTAAVAVVPAQRQEEVLDTPTPNAYYRVAEGDTLGSLSEAAYGNADLFTDIYAENKGVIADMNNLYIGTLLFIPARLVDKVEADVEVAVIDKVEAEVGERVA